MAHHMQQSTATNRRTWDENELRFMRKAGSLLSVQAIAARLDRGVSSVEHKASRLRISLARPRAEGGRGITFSPEEDAILQQCANAEYPSFEEASGRLGRTIGSIKGRSERLQLSFTSRKKRARNRRVYGADFRFFQHLDSELPVYWLGVLAADGSIFVSKKCVSASLRLSVQIRDRQWLETFRDDIQATHPFMFSSSGNGQIGINITSMEMFRDLVHGGLRPNKKYQGFDFPDLPSSLIHHYVRGLFDGDGSVVRRRSNQDLQVTIAGQPNICNWILRTVREHTGVAGGSVLRPYKNARIRVFYLSGRLQVRRFYEWLYQDATRYLDRKHRRFESGYGG